MASLATLFWGVVMMVQDNAPATITDAPVVNKSVTPKPTKVSASPSQQPVATPTTPASAEPVVIPSAAPFSVEVPDLGFQSGVEQESVANMGGIINPPITGYPWQTYWVTDKGVAPGSNSPDTTYLACHTSSKKTDAQAPCNMLSRNDQLKEGYRVVVQTATGELTYRVTSKRKVPRDEFKFDEEVWRVEPDRLVWVMCYITHTRTDYNYVVFAKLVSYESNERG